MNLLIADDEKSLRLALEDELREEGYNVVGVSSGEAAIEELAKGETDLIICDLVMDGLGGKDVLEFIKSRNLPTQFLLMTAYATLQSAIEVLKSGALDYLRKPFEIEQLLSVIRQVKETVRLRKENEELKRKLNLKGQFGTLIGRSPGMLEMFDLASIVSATDTLVMIVGETGTGKNLLAEAIHNASLRRSQPFITVSCASLSRDLLESELFGHEKGAFTGSIRQKKGRFELAHTGTLFLDEVDDIPLETQVKLLNFVQTGLFERVGGEETQKVDVRIIAATKKDLDKLVKEDRFRKDLYYRLNVIQLKLPPLREHPEDIPLLVEHFLKKYSPEKPLDLSPEVMNLLFQHQWEGNIRELEHVIERLVLLNRGGMVDRMALPSNIRDAGGRSGCFTWERDSLPDHLAGIEEKLLKEALLMAEGNRARAAQLLGIPLPTFKSKLQKFRMEAFSPARGLQD